MKVEKIIAAAKVLQKVCGEHETCNKCPLRVHRNECGVLSDVPSEWNLKDNIPKIFID